MFPSHDRSAQFSTDKGIGWFRSDDKVVEGVKGKLDTESLNKQINYYQELVNNGEASPDDLRELNRLKEGTLFETKDITKTRRILEIQSDLFQNGRDKDNLTASKLYTNDEFSSEESYLQESERLLRLPGRGLSETEIQKQLQLLKTHLNIVENPNKNKFLQLLNKDNNWVTFFIKSIIQDSAKKGYEKVLFPKGETAAKIEGHDPIVTGKQIGRAHV